ncbi:MAG TPA: response regulator [Caulobacteraceae bacterium]|nr:response regulator [Caulobacteraceae bacterium]
MAAPTVLIADDHAVSAQLLRHCLASAGFRVICAQDGREAISLMETEAPWLVVLDVMMPVMDGLEVMRRAQADERLRKIPVIMVTSREQDADILEALKLGAADYVVKPFMPADFLTRVARVLADRRRAA